MMKAVIIDDEHSSHNIIKKYLDRLESKKINFKGSAYSVEEGKILISKEHPDLIFLDIEMPDGTGFDLLEQVRKDYSDFKIIFVTGIGNLEYGLRAIQFGAQYYLEKPIAWDHFKEAMQQVLEAEDQDNNYAIIDKIISLYHSRELPNTFVIRNARKQIYRKVSDLVYLKADKNYTEFYFVDGSKLIGSKNLGNYKNQFSIYPCFAQSHRSYLINLKYVDYVTYEENKGWIVLKGIEKKLNLSEKHKNKFLNAFNSYSED